MNRLNTENSLTNVFVADTQILYNSQCFLSPPLPPIFSPPPIQTMPIITNPIVKITKAESSQPD